jgi:hypothetical protein
LRGNSLLAKVLIRSGVLPMDAALVPSPAVGAVGTTANCVAIALRSADRIARADPEALDQRAADCRIKEPAAG